MLDNERVNKEKMSRKLQK